MANNNKKMMTLEERKAFAEKMAAARKAAKVGMVTDEIEVVHNATPENTIDPTKPVEVSKDQDVKDSLSMILEEMKSLKKDNEILMQTADKRALAQYYARNKADLPPIIKLRSLDGKIIVSWKMIEDRGSYQLPNGNWTEYQVLEVTFEDGTTKQLPELEWNRRYETNISAKVVGVLTDSTTKQESLKLIRLDNGEKLEIGVQFIN